MILTRAEVKKILKVFTATTTALVLVAAVLGGVQQAVSALIGAMVLAISAGLLVWSVLRAFEKKSFALAGIVIVIKYLLLAFGLYWICTQPWVSLAWLAAGVGSALLSTLFYGFTWQSEEVG